MQPFKYLTEQLAVAGQLQPEDMQRAHAAGFKTIINNRPDAEEAGQPTNQAIEQAAAQLGLDYYFMPVLASQLTDDNIAEFTKLAPQIESPVLMFCRTGTRCTYLWALAEAANQDVQWLVVQAQQAGYDLSGIAARMEQRRQK